MKYYSKEHEWVKLDGDNAVIGVTSYFIGKLGSDISYVELPKEGMDVIVGDTIGTIESVRDSFDVFSPVSGTVIEVNEILEDDPGIIATSAEDRGWICKLENIDLAEFDDLMDEASYRKYLKKLS